ncbi:MAG TPA: GAF domain-containing protein [Ktedonobacterales bacterium]|nr:GAF domain-containing protein [Ktedonobacterales bacterium]
MAQRDDDWTTHGFPRLRALQQVNAAVNSALDLDQTLRVTAQAVANALGADLCTIFLFDEFTQELELRATSDLSPYTTPHYRVALGQGYTGAVAEQGRPLRETDLADHPDRYASETNRYETPPHGLISMPIIFFMVEKLQGVINVQSSAPRAFTDEDLAFLEVIGGQLAMSIENMRLHEATDQELRRKVNELATLHTVSALVASSLVLDTVLRTIVEKAVLLSGAHRSVLFELQPGERRLRAVAWHGFEGSVEQSALTRANILVGQCCAGRVIETGEPSSGIDCMRSDSGCFLHGLSEEALGDQHAVLCVPLITVHGPLGALCVFSNQRHMLSQHQLQLVMTFANVAAIAMENARLFEQTREGLRKRETLLREMHHRVKNNLAQVAAILNMQQRRSKSEEASAILSETVRRIQGIAATHDLLSTGEVGMAPVDEIGRKIVGVVQGNLVPLDLHLRFHIGSAPYLLPSEQATTLAIVLNELISNAIEHGFEHRSGGEIRISGAKQDDNIVVRVADDGAELPVGFSLDTAEGLGLQLVRGLVRSDLRGSASMFMMEGDPDAHGDDGADMPTEEALAGDGSAPRRWTITELRFPASIMRLGAPETARIEAERAQLN